MRISGPTPQSFRRATIAAILACLLALAIGGSAQAATYSVYACTGPTKDALPNSSWLTSVDDPSQTLFFTFGSICGDLSVRAKNTENFQEGDGASYVFDPPAGTSIVGYALTRAATVDFPTTDIFRPALTAGVREVSGGNIEDRDCDAVVADCVVPTGFVERTGVSLSQVSVGVHCEEATAAGCSAGYFDALSTQLVDARVDLDDPTAPRIASVSGSLPGSSAPAGVLSTSVTATDVGGGVSSIRLSVDGAAPVSAGAGGSCGQPYTLRQPCPSGLVRGIDLDTRQFQNGEHNVTVTAVDAAGNVSAPSEFRFTVSSGGTGGGGPQPSNGSPAVQQPSVRFEKSIISAATGKKEVLVEGTLTTPDGTPIANAVLDVTSLDLSEFGATARTIGTVTTSANGRFSVKVKPDGAHRITVIFKPTPDSLGTAVTSAVVRENLALSIKRSKARVKPRGSLTLSGKLTGAGSASDGAPVEIDARVGGKWRAVGVVETNSKGSWKWKYRFTRVKSSTRFTFRAIVRKNKTWPWPNEASKSVKVLVAR